MSAPVPPSFRALLRRYRDRRRWSQLTAALEADTDHSLWSRLESGQRSPTTDALGKVCRALALSAAERDELYAAAGFLAPDLDRDTVLAALALVRAASAEEIATALHLIAVVRRPLAEAALAALAGRERAA